jgi:hypothetical protein
LTRLRAVSSRSGARRSAQRIEKAVQYSVEQKSPVARKIRWSTSFWVSPLALSRLLVTDNQWSPPFPRSPLIDMPRNCARVPVVTSRGSRATHLSANRFQPVRRASWQGAFSPCGSSIEALGCAESDIPGPAHAILPSTVCRWASASTPSVLCPEFRRGLASRPAP